MASSILHSLAVACLVCLCACGGGGDDKTTKLVVIGNSITWHGAQKSLDWDHDSGMAASSADKDYAHLVAAGWQISNPSITNFATLEIAPADNIAQIPALTAEIDSTTAVVIELGDNSTSGSTEFAAAYARLLDATSARASLACLSTWWQDDVKDAMIKAACTAHGGRYVYIGDIFPVRQDTVVYSDAGVQAHPHDWSMAQIAQRVLK